MCELGNSQYSTAQSGCAGETMFHNVSWVKVDIRESGICSFAQGGKDGSVLFVDVQDCKLLEVFSGWLTTAFICEASG